MKNAAHPNKFAAKCVTCGTHVPAGAGTLAGKVNGQWATKCSAHTPAPAPAPGQCKCGRHRSGRCVGNSVAR